MVLFKAKVLVFFINIQLKRFNLKKKIGNVSTVNFFFVLLDNMLLLLFALILDNSQQKFKILIKHDIWECIYTK